MADVPPTRGLARTALYAGLLAGALDIAAAILQNLEHPARVILQSVATGWLGASAYEGGWSTAWLGLISHFCIMLGIAAIYVSLAVLSPVLRRRWLIASVVWGAVVWAVMSFVIVPVSASTVEPAGAMWPALQGLITHILAVGLPMAWIARRMLDDSR